MAKVKATKEIKEEVKELTSKKGEVEGRKRVVLEISEERLNEIGVLSDLYGKPQYVLVERALAEYVRQNQKAIDSFKEIRKQVLEDFNK